MTSMFDPENAYWGELRKSPAFTPAWNAALWEAHKLISECPPLTREQLLEALRDLVLK